ncbi:MAG TPA: hypothetical protein VMF30_15500 [Pirellulales bacterium]|nr:hypothetical protein [Pirellulales bacterium]
MAPADEESMKRRYRELLDLMPLTREIAGLPASTGAFYYNPDQMEARAQTLLLAFKLARGLAREVVGGA